MCIDFDGHHSGGSSFDSVIRCGPYPRVQVRLFKKKLGKESQYMVSHSELGLDPPIGLNLESGCDKLTLKDYFDRSLIYSWSENSWMMYKFN